MTADFWLEMIWKSAVISAAGLSAALLLRRRSAAERVMVLRLAVGALLVLPLLALGLPGLEVEVPVGTAVQALAPQAVGPTSAPAEASWWSDRMYGAMASLYAIGLLMMASRLLIGLHLLLYWTRKAARLGGPWAQALARAADGGRVSPRVLLSPHVPGPLSWGLFRPAILIDRISAERTEAADAILSHELSHIARGDWGMLMLSRIAVALFWFNPLAWILARELEQQSEQAADQEAARRWGRARYAELLMVYARQSTRLSVPAHGMASASATLSRRIQAVLDGSRTAPAGAGWGMLAALALMGMAAPIAAVEIVTSTHPTAPSQARGDAAQVPARKAEASAAAAVRPVLLSTKLSHLAQAEPAGPKTAAPARVESLPAPSSTTFTITYRTEASQAGADSPSIMERHADTMERHANTMDREANALESRVQALRERATAGESGDAKAAKMEMSVAGLRLSAAGTRINAAALRRHLQIEREADKPPE
jgi:beta-lactamase regulating signal transducer with metallopeptidase domain